MDEYIYIYQGRSQYSKLRKRERVVIIIGRPTSRSPFVRPSNSIHAVLSKVHTSVPSCLFPSLLHVVANRYPRETPLPRCIVQPRSQRVVYRQCRAFPPNHPIRRRVDIHTHTHMYIHRRKSVEILAVGKFVTRRHMVDYHAPIRPSNATNRTYRKRLRACLCPSTYTYTLEMDTRVPLARSIRAFGCSKRVLYY